MWEDKELSDSIGYYFLPELKNKLKMNKKTNHAICNYENFEEAM